ncbi:thioredoxin family protein [Desulfovibrio psychrotolerans]|uniref:Redox-active disulfide protein 2 n=1 Tax=Desulfovibrio psychrotolerans TaxID=415242 RepID=A0A7J0BZN4_9BACT|nr:thioredoxin family protein [Desulfovibrio psychrotolerans]GFM38642.1 redox-active disulfide protein 2 [Desulfovibrio psychrotolerans]
MKKILVLGPGCPKCEQLKNDAEAAAKELGIAYEIEKIGDISKMLSFGVMTTPALVVDGEVKVVGKVPSMAELKKMLA